MSRFLFISRVQQLLLFTKNMNSRASQIIKLPLLQTRYWFTTTTPDDVQVEVEVEGRDELSRAVKYRNSLKLRAMSKVTNPGPDGHLPPQVTYLLDLGFSHDQIKDMVRRHPHLAYLSLEGKIKPFIEFLVELGVTQSGVPNIIFKRPGLCGLSISGNILPTMTYFESLGINKSQWAKVIHRFPPLLSLSRQKIKDCVDFFLELGFSEEAVGKLMTQNPSVVGRNIDSSLTPTMNFFLDKGFKMDELLVMISRFGNLCCHSLVDNIQPKWDFFLTTGYPHSELVKFPQYFGYSLEGRIKPRFSRMVSCGVSAPLISVLAVSDVVFERMVQNKLKKMEACLDKRTAPGKDSE